MKAEIKKSGLLEITAETELEAFALEEWTNKYFTGNDIPGQTVIKDGKILFNWSLNSGYKGTPDL